MRTLYFDCFAGASGDMTLGALVSAGADAGALVEGLALLDVAGYEVSFERVDRSGISATRAHVRTQETHHHRHLSDIRRIIEASRLSDAVKRRAVEIFTRLAEAEARVHDMPVERIHFHEVGALDAIVDVVGACIGFELLGIERFLCSPLHVGSGMVEMAHGRFPVPPPAVTELLRDAPIYATDVQGELVTPTGAAIISTVCEAYLPVPPMRVERTGYGAGGREYERFPNVLRVLVGETEAVKDEHKDASGVERLFVVETNLDDASPQIVGHLLERAFALGARLLFHARPDDEESPRRARLAAVPAAAARRFVRVAVCRNDHAWRTLARGRAARAGARVRPCRDGIRLDCREGRAARRALDERDAGV
jgi:hypothetical protein